MRKHVFRALTTAAAIAALFFSAAMSDMVTAAGATGSGNDVANPSPGPVKPPTVAVPVEIPGGWAVLPITERDHNSAKAAAEGAEARAEIEERMPGWTFDAVMDVWDFGWYTTTDEEGNPVEPEDGTVMVKMPALPDNENYDYVLLHYPTSDWTNITVSPDLIAFTLLDSENNYWGFKVAGGSPIVFVRVRKIAPPATGDNEYTDGTVELVPEELPEGIQQGAITTEAHDLGVDAAKNDNTKSQLQEKLPGWIIDVVVDVLDLQVEKEGQVAVKMPVLPDRDNYIYVALHYTDWTFSNYPEVIQMTLADWTTNKWTFKVTSGSPYVFVRLRKVVETNDDNDPVQTPLTTQTVQPASQPAEAQGAPVSPKTGEGLPAATGIALLCLAGIAACAKKAESRES